MTRVLQQYFSEINTAHKAFFGMVQNGLWDAVFQIKLYANPTLYRRLGVDLYGNREIAYQKAESRFDNYSVRAIIRDEKILNGHQRRPQRYPF
jgi:hypothetical protein